MGTVVGFTGGTGAAFSVVPAQVAAHPLRAGLSMNVDIAVSEYGSADMASIADAPGGLPGAPARALGPIDTSGGH